MRLGVRRRATWCRSPQTATARPWTALTADGPPGTDREQQPSEDKDVMRCCPDYSGRHMR
jgi:hypothetical protein